MALPSRLQSTQSCRWWNAAIGQLPVETGRNRPVIGLKTRINVMGYYRQCIFDPCADAILIQPSSLNQITNSSPGVLPLFHVELDCSDAVFV